MNRVYTTDPIVPYKFTSIRPEETRQKIDELLHKYGIPFTAWEWNLNYNKVAVHFNLDENINGKRIQAVIKLEPPTIWDSGKGPWGKQIKEDTINWAVSMRCMYWWLKTTLENNYLKSGEKTVAFLANIEINKNQTIKDVLVPKLPEMNILRALPDNNQIVQMIRRK